jgi:hypothetical protein
MDVSWELGGKSLAYAIEPGPASSDFYIEPKNWNWWQFDLASRRNTPLPPPESSIDLETRLALGVCSSQSPEEASTDGCAGASMLWESPYGDRVVYTPADRGETILMARKDGSGVVDLEDIPGVPAHVQWTSDGRWLLISVYAYRAPGMEDHYLVDTDGRLVRPLEELTGHTLVFVNYLRPQFSPDGQYLVYAATDNPDHKVENDYGLFLLNLSTLQAEPLTERFGPFQWEANSQGLFVLDNAVIFEFAEDMDVPRKAALYQLDVPGRPSQETLLFDNIDYYPNDSMSSRHWGYSPEAQAISMVGLQPEHELGILLLAP